MPNHTTLFSSFPKNSKTEWLAKIEKDLKGKSLAALDWSIEEQLKLSGFYHREDLNPSTGPLVSPKLNNAWAIGEYIKVNDPVLANATTLEGLVGGVSAPLFQLYHLPNKEELALLLKDIEVRFIEVHFALNYPGKDPAVLFKDLIYYARTRGLLPTQIKASVDFDPLLDWVKPPYKALARMLRFANLYAHNFRVLQINGQVYENGVEHTAQELALILAKGVTYIDELEKEGITPEVVNNHLQFSLAVGDSYFINIAKIRALKILWANILKAYNLSTEQLPKIMAHTSKDAQTDNREYNMIKAATQCMAAAIGGADTIFVLPSDDYTTPTSSSFSRRIARNVQHVLQMESHINQVVDPSAGSYYIESITTALCEQAWKQFQAIEKLGGFTRIK